MHTIIGLPRTPRGGKGTFPCVGYDIKYPFRRVIPVGSKGTQQSMWPLFHGMDAKKWQTNKVKWGVSRQHDNNEICGRLRRRSRTRSTIPQLPEGDNFSTHFGGNGTPTAKNASALQQCHCNWHSKQLNQTTVITINGHAFFLGGR